MKIILADDQKEVRAALRFALQYRHSHWQIIEASNAQDLITLVKEASPMLILLALEPQPQFSKQASAHHTWAQWLASLRNSCPTVKIIALVSSPEWITPAWQAGSDAVVCKADPIETVEMAIEQLISG